MVEVLRKTSGDFAFWPALRTIVGRQSDESYEALLREFLKFREVKVGYHPAAALYSLTEPWRARKLGDQQQLVQAIRAARYRSLNFLSAAWVLGELRLLASVASSH